MVKALTFAGDLTQVASQQVYWLTTQGRAQHTGPDGNQPSDRAATAGYSISGEVLLTSVQTGTIEEEIQKCFDGWKSSPHHMAILTDPSVEVMGWAWGTYPQSLERLIIGAGSYDPETGGYTADDTYYDIPEADRGKLRVYLLMVAA